MTKEDFITAIVLLGFTTSKNYFYPNKTTYSYFNVLYIQVSGYNAMKLEVDNRYIGCYNFDLCLTKLARLLQECKEAYD